MSSQDESVREFIAITDVDAERARFFLESAGWDLQVRAAPRPPDPRPPRREVTPKAGRLHTNYGDEQLASWLTLAAFCRRFCASHPFTQWGIHPFTTHCSHTHSPSHAHPAVVMNTER
ncbi:hypothetical protein NHX12_012712 [Muraenolepis orangiensis]|uniref:Uncharacterized protein n=1 Tax=Muraenolepis orangiensis TaxID=630683 RepID=A0A9Q0DDI9_9TELE|nr:hypothetical protein NHX12_012712 [Muraenolepis orangiensis]